MAPTALNGEALGGSQLRWLGASDEVANIHADVACDGAEKRGRDVSAVVEGNRCYATIGMSILAVRTTLADLNESETGQDKGSSGNKCYEMRAEAPGGRGARRRNTRRIATTSDNASRDGSAPRSYQLFPDEP